MLLVDVNPHNTDRVVRARGDFGKWIVKHIDSWFAFARGLGLGIEHMEEIEQRSGCTHGMNIELQSVGLRAAVKKNNFALNNFESEKKRNP